MLIALFERLALIEYTISVISLPSVLLFSSLIFFLFFIPHVLVVVSLLIHDQSNAFQNGAASRMSVRNGHPAAAVPILVYQDSSLSTARFLTAPYSSAFMKKPTQTTAHHISTASQTDGVCTGYTYGIE